MANMLVKPDKRRPSTENRRDVQNAGPSGLSAVLAPDSALEELVSLFKLVADDTRLRILYYLTQRPELHVRALCELLSQSQPAVSHHLALLRMAGLIDRRREGKHNYYGLRTGRLTDLLDAFFARLPEENRQIRFEEYELRHTPASRSEAPTGSTPIVAGKGGRTT